jgi:uncharacterized membrane protein
MTDAGNTTWSTTRIESFSDGVIAIIITIMVLELKAPAEAFARGNLAEVIRNLGPELLVYALSFLIVAIMTINHHTLMRIPPYATTALFWWNALLLFWMSLVPLSMSVFARSPTEPLAVAGYGVNMVGTSSAFVFLRRCASRIGHPDGVPANLRPAVIKNAVSTSLWIASVPLAYVSVYISIAIFVAISAYYFVPEFILARYARGAKSTPST